MVRRSWRVLALLAVSIASTAYPQGLPPALRAFPGAPQATPGTMMMPERMAMIDPDKKLAVGDQVTLEIVEDREGGLPRTISATGELDVPPLGRVRVSGRTASEAAGEIKQLLERNYYYHATVHLAIDRVSPTAVRAGAVQVSGEVRIGGQQEIVAGESLTLTNAIYKAGGITEWGNPEKVQLTRLGKNGKLDTTVANFKKITKSGDARLDPVLQDGDRIFVPRRIVRLY
jgi:protein involved in polysaccharide export with SLBB domain